MSEDQQNKMQRIALELNKSGLSYLFNQQGNSNAFDYFKKAQKLLMEEIKIDNHNQKAQSLLAVTCNNIAIYYKRTGKPKAALTYLKKALQIQAIVLNDWLAASTTHLNVCAIYSYMGRHNEAVEHAKLSIEMAHKAKQYFASEKNKNENAQKSCSNIQLTSLYNLAVEYEHLKKFQDAKQTHIKVKDTARQLGSKKIQINSKQSINKLQQQINKNKQKMIEILQKKKQYQEKQSYLSMRKNIKNFKSMRSDQQNYQNDFKSNQRYRKAQSLIKIKSLKISVYKKPIKTLRKHVFKNSRDQQKQSTTSFRNQDK